MTSSAERLLRVARLPPHERRVLLRAWWHFLFVAVALRWMPMPWLLRRRVVAAPPRPPLALERLQWLVNVARRCAPVRGTCLTEALVLARLLRAEGIDATVRIGVTRSGGGVRAHAWVEYLGRPVLPAVTSEPYTPLAAAGSRPRSE